MTNKTSALLLAGAMILVGLTNFSSSAKKTDPEVLNAYIARSLAYQVLSAKESPSFDFERVADAIQVQLEETEFAAPILKVAILIFHLQGKSEKALALLERYRAAPETDQPDVAILAFALGQDVFIPQDWEVRVSEDWAGAQTSALIYKRLEMEQSLASAELSLSYYKAQADTNMTSRIWLSMIGFWGVFVILANFWAHLRLNAMGKHFFVLAPLRIPLDIGFYFAAMFLAGYALVSGLVAMTLSQAPDWASFATHYVLVIGLAYGLLRFKVFPKNHAMIPMFLGFSHLRFRFQYVIHGIGGLALAAFFYNGTSVLLDLLGWPYDGVQSILDMTVLMQDPISATVFIFLGCLVAPFFEEIVFRGFLLRVFLKHMPPYAALCLSSLLFALLHPIPVMPQVFVLGCCFGFLYLRTARLEACIWAHAAWNTMMVLLLRFGALG